MYLLRNEKDKTLCILTLAVQSQQIQCYNKIRKANVIMLIFILYTKILQKPANVPSV